MTKLCQSDKILIVVGHTKPFCFAATARCLQVRAYPSTCVTFVDTWEAHLPTLTRIHVPYHMIRTDVFILGPTNFTYG